MSSQNNYRSDRHSQGKLEMLSEEKGEFVYLRLTYINGRTVYKYKHTNMTKKESKGQTRFFVHVVIFSKEKNRTMLDFNYVERTILKWCSSSYLSKKENVTEGREYLPEICSPWSRRCKYLI